MPTTITVKGVGDFDFPDSMSEAEIHAVIRRKFGPSSFPSNQPAFDTPGVAPRMPQDDLEPPTTPAAMFEQRGGPIASQGQTDLGRFAEIDLPEVPFPTEVTAPSTAWKDEPSFLSQVGEAAKTPLVEFPAIPPGVVNSIIPAGFRSFVPKEAKEAAGEVVSEMGTAMSSLEGIGLTALAVVAPEVAIPLFAGKIGPEMVGGSVHQMEQGAREGDTKEVYKGAANALLGGLMVTPVARARAPITARVVDAMETHGRKTAGTFQIKPRDLARQTRELPPPLPDEPAKPQVDQPPEVVLDLAAPDTEAVKPTVEQVAPPASTPAIKPSGETVAEPKPPELMTPEEFYEKELLRKDLLGENDKLQLGINKGSLAFDISGWTRNSQDEASGIRGAFIFSPERTGKTIIEFPSGTILEHAASALVEAIKQGDGPGSSWLPLGLSDSIQSAFKNKQSVLADSANAFQIIPPKGYVREGDLYVYKPEAKPAAPDASDLATSTETKPASVTETPTATTPAASTTAEATAKVKAEIVDTAKTKGVRSAKDIKDELVTRLEKAIEDAPAQSEYDSIRGTALTEKAESAAIKTTIEIPGDGTFTVFNRKEALQELLKRAKRISTASTAKPTLPKGGPGDLDTQAKAAAKAYGSAESAYVSAKRQRNALSDNDPETPKRVDEADALIQRLFESTEAGKLDSQWYQLEAKIREQRQQLEMIRGELQRAQNKPGKTAKNKESVTYWSRREIDQLEAVQKLSKEQSAIRISADEAAAKLNAQADEIAKKQQGDMPLEQRMGNKAEDTQGAIATAGPPLQPAQTAGTPTTPIKPISEIIRDLAKGLNIPIRFGRLTTSKFAGYFKKTPNLIGAKFANDMPIVAHEVGHKLDASVYRFSADTALRTELEALGDPAVIV